MKHLVHHLLFDPLSVAEKFKYDLALIGIIGALVLVMYLVNSLLVFLVEWKQIGKP